MRVGTRVAIADLGGFVESEAQGLMVGATGRVVRVGHGSVFVELDLVHVAEPQWYHFPWQFLESELEVLDESVF